ncbi:MAG TPA: ATP phosphoribosyltransferase [Phenylobacterium sp.]|nr:ATP phosphoribosyltransferase [Phenylobacterium sp.]
MSEPLILAVPSKGRLKEQVDAWLADCGLPLKASGGARGYLAEMTHAPDVQVRLLSAADIAAAVVSGEAHLGVTGEDLIGEQPAADRALRLVPLGVGRADLVVATPQSWLDVDDMADLAEVSHDILHRTGRRMRVATKYVVQTRAFLAAHDVDFRIVFSGGATEGAPAAGAAECVVDITTTGATLLANGLKQIDGGLILKSQAWLAASLAAAWSPSQRAAADRLLRIIEARVRARGMGLLSWSETRQDEAAAVLGELIAAGGRQRGSAILLPTGRMHDAGLGLAQAGAGPISASLPLFVFDQASEAGDRLNRGLTKF